MNYFSAANFQDLRCLPYQTVIFIQNLRPSNLHVNLPLWSHSVRTDWPSFRNSNPVRTLFAAVAVVKPIAATIDIALYLHNFTSHHEHSYSKYALADCSLIFSFVSNYDRSCVYSNSTVSVAAYCFTDVILQDTDLAVPWISLDSPKSLTGFLSH
jgi:hypothetical protein